MEHVKVFQHLISDDLTEFEQKVNTWLKELGDAEIVSRQTRAVGETLVIVFFYRPKG